MAIDPAWENIFRSRVWGVIPCKEVVFLLVANYYFRERAEINILDLGCGVGANTWYPAAEGYNVYAIDGSPTAIEKAKELLVRANAKAHFDQGDFADLPYGNGLFDMVIDVASISCNDAIDSALIYKEVARVMKQGGILFTRCFAPGTDPDCFAEGTYNRISELEEINWMLKDDFIITNYEKISRHATGPISKKPVIVCEWVITAKRK